MRYTHIRLIKIIIGIAQMWFQIPMSVGWILVFEFPNPTTILKQTLFLDPLHTL
jgi:hypothetical protein